MFGRLAQKNNAKVMPATGRTTSAKIAERVTKQFALISGSPNASKLFRKPSRPFHVTFSCPFDSPLLGVISLHNPDIYPIIRHGDKIWQ